MEGGDLGRSVAISGDVLVAGAPGENADKGQVHVYRRVDGEWIEEAVLLPPPTFQWFEWFGWEVAVDGDRIAVGDYSEWTDSSLRVVTFKHDNGEWVQESILDYSHIDEDKYGWWLSLDGDFLLVNGSWAQVNYLYERVEGEWIQRAALDGDPNPFTTGHAVVSRGRHVAEIFGEPDGLLYRRDGNAWIQMDEFSSATGEDVYEGSLELIISP